MKLDLDTEQLIEQLIHQVKTGGNVSNWQKNREVSPVLKIIKLLASMPKAEIPEPNFVRIRNQILNKISSPKQKQPSLIGHFPKTFRLVISLVGSLAIILSLAVGTAVAALQSVPGQPLYPLKKVVENLQLHLATNEAERADLQLQFASERLDELTQVLENPDIPPAEIQKIVAATVKDVKQTANAAAKISASQPKPAIVNKLVNLDNKLRSASIQTEGEIKTELEKALESTTISKEEALRNMERAGLKVESSPLIIEEPREPKDQGTETEVK